MTSPCKRFGARRALRVGSLLCLGACSAAPVVTSAPPVARIAEAPTLLVRNNHELPYRGPVELPVGLADGIYSAGRTVAEVRGGIARVFVSLGPNASESLRRVGDLTGGRAFGQGMFSAVPAAVTRLDLAWKNQALGALELGLAVAGGNAATADDAVATFTPLSLAWRTTDAGRLHGTAAQDGYQVDISATPYGAGFLDAEVRLTRVAPTSAAGYVALIRRVTSPVTPTSPGVRFNGRVFDNAAASPDTWDRDFWYTKGVDWTRWTLGNVQMLDVPGFTPTPTILNDKGAWAEASHFYVWERTRQVGNAMYLVSEIAGPNPDQAKSRYMPVTQYASVPQGDTVALRWRLAVTEQPTQGWEEVQMRAFAGYLGASVQPATATAGMTTIDVGVPAVAFGTSYFPYSTFNENFDYFRLPGTNQETWWPIATGQWNEWQKYVPRMRTDLHIIRALGFDVVRLHHLELLRHIEPAQARAFLDFYMTEVRALGMKVLIDSEGPASWIAEVVGRYPALIHRVELENEILIQGIKPGDAERWTTMYRATKAVAPDTEVFLTTAGNHGQFERLRRIGVPFDRVGLHAYKHGPRWMESFSSHALGTGGYATSLGMEATLGEFNWKEFTRQSPELRTETVRTMYDQILAPRALSELLQFHFQETMSISPAISRSGVRHYEPMALDRRLKPEGEVLRDAIRRFTRTSSPVRLLPMEIAEVRFAAARARGTFRVANSTPHTLTVQLRPYAFDGTAVALESPADLTLRPGEVHEGIVTLSLAGDARPGTYHYFVAATYRDTAGTSGVRDINIGWGVASHVGAPRFGPSIVNRATYAGAADALASLDWTERPIAVTFGAKAHWLEMEMAYLLANTLQASTGRRVRLSTVEDLLPEHRSGGLVVAVGTPAMNAMVGEAGPLRQAGVPFTYDRTGAAARAHGTVAVHRAEGRQWLVVSGDTKEAVEAAAMDLLLRYWPNAKDAAIRISGMEKGQLLGNRAGVTNPDPP